MGNKVIVALSAVIVIGLLLGTKVVAGAPSIEGALSKANPNGQLLYNLVTKSGTVAFYESSDNLVVSLLKKGLLGWKLIDGGAGVGFAEKAGLSWSFVNIGGSGPNQIHLLLGTINNPQIKRVEVKTSSGTPQGTTIIETTKGRIFYILYDKAQHPPAKILGLSDQGNHLYEY